MAQTIYFPSETVSTDFVPDPLLTVLYDKIEESKIVLTQPLFSSSLSVVVSFTNTDTSNLGIQYSKDDITYQNSNTIEIDEPGVYDIYVKDKFGCKKSKQIEVVGSELNRDDYVYISKGNAINFVELQEVDDIYSFKNDSNSFQCQELATFKYSGNLMVNKLDVISFQIKSNYEKIEMYFRNEKEEIIPLELTKKSNNLDNFYSCDSNLYSNENGKLAMYFESGNVYNSLGDVIGTHELDGDLPEFGKIGNNVQVSGFGLLKISSISIDYDLNKTTLIFDQEYLGEDIEVVVVSVYDLLPYEIYEDYFKFNKLEDGLYDFYIKVTNSKGGTREFQSYNIELSDKHEDTLSIHYYNTSNRSLFYEYDLVNQLRVTYCRAYRFNNQESEININDNSSESITSVLNFGYTFVFEDLTTKQSESLSLALSCESVFINGIGYVKSDDISLTNQENTNVYSLEVNMLETNKRLEIENKRNNSITLFFLSSSIIDWLIPNLYPII